MKILLKIKILVFCNNETRQEQNQQQKKLSVLKTCKVFKHFSISRVLSLKYNNKVGYNSIFLKLFKYSNILIKIQCVNLQDVRIMNATFYFYKINTIYSQLYSLYLFIHLFEKRKIEKSFLDLFQNFSSGTTMLSRLLSYLVSLLQKNWNINFSSKEI